MCTWRPRSSQCTRSLDAEWLQPCDAGQPWKAWCSRPFVPSKVRAPAMSCQPPRWRQSGDWWIFGCCHSSPGYGWTHLPSQVLQPGLTGGAGGGGGGPVHCLVILPSATARGARPVQWPPPLWRGGTWDLRQQRSPCAELAIGVSIQLAASSLKSGVSSSPVPGGQYCGSRLGVNKIARERGWGWAARSRRSTWCRRGSTPRRPWRTPATTARITARPRKTARGAEGGRRTS